VDKWGIVAVAAANPRSLIGIGPHAESVWRSLAACPRFDFAQHAQETGLSIDDVRSHLQELLEFGLVREAIDSPVGMVAVDPAPVLETQLARRERELAESAERIAAIRAMLPEVRDSYARGLAAERASSGFELVQTLEGIRREVYLAAGRVRSDIRSLYPAGGSPAVALLAAMDHGRTTQLETLDRGVCDRSILDEEMLIAPEVVARQDEIRLRGGLLRTLPKVSSRFSIFDRELAIVAVDPVDSSRGAMLIRAQGLIDSLLFMFDHLWTLARPVFEIREHDLPQVRGARILEFMAAGMKDDRIARALGVGPRTIRRDISELKDTLGVSSRTEIVAAAAKRGWL
jgi:DNA-binding CsgD family transcriptional regulator